LTAAALLAKRPWANPCRPAGLSRPNQQRDASNSACFGCADAEAGTPVGASPEGRSPNTGGAAEAPRTDPDNIDSTA